jgi:hypothetical protein
MADPRAQRYARPAAAECHVPISFRECSVMLLNTTLLTSARAHLATSSPSRWRAIKSSWDVEVGNRQFEELCDRFAKPYPTWRLRDLSGNVPDRGLAA